MTDVESTALEEPKFHVILTDRLRLRTLRVSDADKMMPILTEEKVMRWTSHGIVSNVAQAERWLRDRALGPDVFNFAIELRQDRESDPPIVGAVGSFHLPEIGYMIHPRYGYATEAIQAVIPELFDRIPPLNEDGTGLDHIEGWTDINNFASQRILQKCGFTHCETIPDPENPVRGPSEIAIFRKARPGKTLESLGFLPSKEVDAIGSAPQPPVQ